jgi:hypothetical protein
MDQFNMMTNKNIIRVLGLPSFLNPNLLLYSNAKKAFLQEIYYNYLHFITKMEQMVN